MRTWRPSRISPSREMLVILLPPRRTSRDRLFPVPPIEAVRLKRRRIDAVETADVDVDLIGVRARHVEGVDAAGGAEGVPRGAGVEPVGGQRILAAEEFELLGRHNEM